MVVQIKIIRSALPFTARCLILILFAIDIHVDIIAQKTSFLSDVKYVDYLKERKMYAEAQYVLTQMDTAMLTVQQKDSIIFLLGGVYLLSSKADSSIKLFNKVSEVSICYGKALVANAYNYWHNKQYNLSEGLLRKTLNNANDSSLQYLTLLMLSANELLKYNPAGYNTYSGLIETSDEMILSKKNALRKVYQTEISFHKKSPVVAGLLSAIVPGLGKWYVGKPNEALGAFIPVASLGLLTYEAYRKGGTGSLGFVSFASMFSIFYFGNIWGSIVSVKLRNESYTINNEKNIVVSMLVPIDRLLR